MFCVPFAGDHPLKVNMQSQYKQGKLIQAIWIFIPDGQHPSYCKVTNQTATWSPDTGSTVKEPQAKRDCEGGLRKLSEGDFRNCLNNLFTYLREELSKLFCKLLPRNFHRVGKAWPFP